ncbi:MAG: acetyl-CoA hydrolase/transferase family protein [Thermoanaerobaculum sp.]
MQWHEIYRRRVTTAEEAVKAIRSGDHVWVHGGCNNPEELIKAMVGRAQELSNVTVIHILTFGRADYADPKYEGVFRHRALFTGPNVRQAVNEGRADFVPVHLSQIPRLIQSGILPIDVALIHISPPDEHGFCSFGVGVECTKAAAEKARTVIALVNRQMPRALGDAFIHVSRLTHVVEIDRPVLELPQAQEIGPTARAIGEHIAELIEDGSTLQMGIGEIPDAVLLFLKDKKHLGIHTEMFSDGLVELVESGVVTNERKTLHRGKTIASFVLGSKRTFDFLDNNPFVEFHPSDYVNNPFVIAQNAKMVAINSALAVDLTGQVCADSLGTSIYSGFGGQVDFIRGAAASEGGKPIIALPSTAKGGTVSRILDTLAPGSGVVTTRADVHYVVTEFGVASLFGKSLRERAQELIAVAHPDFRDELRAAARRRQLL